MKLHIIKILLILLPLLLVAGNLLRAQRTEFLDLKTNNSITCELKNLLQTYPFANIDQPVLVNYPFFGTEDYPNGSLNNYLEDKIYTLYRDTSFYTKLQASFQKAFPYDPAQCRPEVESVQCRVVAFGNDLLCFKVDYNEALYCHTTKKTRCESRLYYYVMSANKGYTTAEVFNPGATRELNRMLLSRLQKNNGLSRLIGTDTAHLSERGYLLPLTPSLAFQIPVDATDTASPCVNIYFTVAELKPYLNPQGPYAAFSSNKPTRIDSDFVKVQKKLKTESQMNFGNLLEIAHLDSLHVNRNIKKIELNQIYVDMNNFGGQTEFCTARLLVQYDKNGFIYSYDGKEDPTSEIKHTKIYFYYRNDDLVKDGLVGWPPQNPKTLAEIVAEKGGASIVYDPQGRIICSCKYDKSRQAYNDFTQYQYDSKGHVNTIFGDFGFRTFDYDNRDNLIRIHIKQQNYGNITYNKYNFSYEYYDGK